MAFNCPVCGESFPESSTTPFRFQRHVNRCLDGVPDVEDDGPHQQHERLTANPESQVSLGSLADSPVSEGRQNATGTANHRGPAGPLLHVESSSLDYYTAIQDNCDFICGLCPDFPRALVEEVLLANGNEKDVAMSTLFELKDQAESAALSHRATDGGGVLHSHWGGDDRHQSAAPRTYVRRTALQRMDGESTDATTTRGAQQSSPVELVIYDLQPDSTVAKKIGLGAYHTGVVIYGHEFSFGGTRNLKADTGKPGIWATRKLYATAPVIKKRITVGTTYVTIKELQSKLKEWGATEWRVDDYHLLAKNCNHFAEALLAWLADKSTIGPTSAGNTGAVVSPAASPSTSSNVPAGARPIPLFADVQPSAAKTPSSAVGVFPPPSSLLSPQPVFPLPPSQLKLVKEAFRLPAWVNRAAAVGNAVVPDFIFKKIVEALMPPVPDDDDAPEPAPARTTKPSSTPL